MMSFVNKQEKLKVDLREINSFVSSSICKWHEGFEGRDGNGGDISLREIWS